MTVSTTRENPKNKKHELSLLNNCRLEYDADTKSFILWIYHDRLYINGTYYRMDQEGSLFLCTTRENSYNEEKIF